MPNPGPDFLCVGTVKGGSRWLFDQVQHHPDFWMAPIKELHYFDRGDDTRGRNAAEALRQAKRLRKSQKKTGRRYEDRDYQFLSEFAAQSGPLDISQYAFLFRHKDELKTGDVTPHYCNLEKDLIAKITGALPHLRLVLLVRDPVARAWSQISQEARRGKYKPEILQTPEGLSSCLADWRRLDRFSAASRAARRWMPSVPKEQFRYFFMDDIAERPAETRAAIIEFLGGDPAKASGELPPDHNPKAGGKKLQLTDDLRAVLAEHFKEELLACAKIFGCHAETWARRYGY